MIVFTDLKQCIPMYRHWAKLVTNVQIVEPGKRQPLDPGNKGFIEFCICGGDYIYLPYEPNMALDIDFKTVTYLFKYHTNINDTKFFFWTFPCHPFELDMESGVSNLEMVRRLEKFEVDSWHLKNMHTPFKNINFSTKPCELLKPIHF